MLTGYGLVVTAGAGGIGSAIARRAAELGAQVVVSDLDEDAAQAAAQRVRDAGGRALALRCDVTRVEDCQALVRQAEDFFGAPVDVFVANAGRSFAGDFLKTDPQELRRVVEVNVLGSLYSAQAALGSLVRSPRASLVFTSSISALVARSRRSAYNASKHALTGLVKALALEFGPAGVRVNAVAPGPTDTPFLRAHLAKVEPDAQVAAAALAAALPLGRLIEPQEVAEAVCWLAGPAARAVTGQTLAVDGGSTAGRM